MKRKKVSIVIFLLCLLLLDTASCKDAHDVSFFTHEIHTGGTSQDVAMSNKGSADNTDRKKPLTHDDNRILKPGVSFRHGGTSAIAHQKPVVHPRIKATKGFRWKFHQDLPKMQEVKKGSHSKTKSKKSHSKTEDDTESSSAAIVGGILAGVLALPFIVTGIALLWKKCQRKTIRPADSETGLVVISRTADLDGDLSDGEIIYEKKVVMCKKQDSDSKTASCQNGQPSSPSPSPPPFKLGDGPIIAWEDTPGMQTPHSSGNKTWTFNSTSEFTLPGATAPSDPFNLTPSDTSLTDSLSANSLTSESKAATFYKEPNMAYATCPVTTPDVVFASDSCTSTEKPTSTGSLSDQFQRPEPESILFQTRAELPGLSSKDCCSNRISKMPEKLILTVALDEEAVNSSRESCNMLVMPCDKVEVKNEEDGENIKSSSTTAQNVNSSSDINEVSGKFALASPMDKVGASSPTEYCSIPIPLDDAVVVNMEDEQPCLSSSTTYQGRNSSSYNDNGCEEFTLADPVDTIADRFSRESCNTPVRRSNEVVIDLEGHGDLPATSPLSISVDEGLSEKPIYTSENRMTLSTTEDDTIKVDHGDEHHVKVSESEKRIYTNDESKLESNTALNRGTPCKKASEMTAKSNNYDCEPSATHVDIAGREERCSKGIVENRRFQQKNKRRLIMEKGKESRASLRERKQVAKLLIVDDGTDAPIWKSALQAMKRSKERCQAIQGMMGKVKISESRDGAHADSADAKTDNAKIDEKQIPLNEENHFQSSQVTGTDEKMLVTSSTSRPEADPPASPTSRAWSEYKPSRHQTSSQATHPSTLLKTSTIRPEKPRLGPNTPYVYRLGVIPPPSTARAKCAISDPNVTSQASHSSHTSNTPLALQPRWDHRTLSRPKKTRPATPSTGSNTSRLFGAKRVPWRRSTAPNTTSPSELDPSPPYIYQPKTYHSPARFSQNLSFEAGAERNSSRLETYPSMTRSSPNLNSSSPFLSATGPSQSALLVTPTPDVINI